MRIAGTQRQSRSEGPPGATLPEFVFFQQAPQLKALHLVSESARPKLRILCLHGYLQNGKVGETAIRASCLLARPGLTCSRPHTRRNQRPSIDRSRLTFRACFGSITGSVTARLHSSSLPAVAARQCLCPRWLSSFPKVFSRRTRQLSRKLKGVAELVYVDAPHLLAPEELPPPLPVRATVAGQSPKEHPVEDSNPEMEICEALEGLACPVPSPASSPPPRPEREEARAWWRCDAEERRRAKAMPGMAGRCKWKVDAVWFGRVGVGVARTRMQGLIWLGFDASHYKVHMSHASSSSSRLCMMSLHLRPDTLDLGAHALHSTTQLDAR